MADYQDVQSIALEQAKKRPMGMLVTPGHQQTFTDNSVATNNAVNANAVPNDYAPGATWPEIGEAGNPLTPGA